MFKGIIGIIGLGMLMALAQYATGRIILPEMGLTAPGYGPWLAVVFLVEMPVIFGGAILEHIGRPTYSRRW